MNSEQIGGLVRSLVIAAGAIFVTKGWLTDVQVAAIAGSVAVLVGIGWSIYSNSTHHMVAAVAKDADVVKVVVSPALVFATSDPKVVTK